MNPQRLIGVVLLVLGVVLLIVGVNSSHSIADKVSDTVSGRYTDATMWYIIGGIGAGVIGLLMVLFGLRAKSA